MNFPHTTSKFLKALRNLALMEFLPTDEVVDYLSETLVPKRKATSFCTTCDEDDVNSLEEADDEVFASKIVDSTYSKLGSDDLVRNLGIMLVILLAIILLLVMLQFLKACMTGIEWMKKIYKTIY